jgi:SAM-dependent methyltransferase
MDRETVLQLNAINRAFYRSAASEFSASRARPWPGFERVARHMAAQTDAGATPRFLDVGCGNGRFADALLDELETPFLYTGVEASPLLAEEAVRRHRGQAGFRFLVHDFVAGSLSGALAGARFAGVALLGVLHHVPGSATRRRLLAELAQHLEPGGVLALSIWRFAQFERFRRRVVPWETWLARDGAKLDLAQLEPGDVLLPFGAGEAQLRYCHALDESEARELLASLPLEPLDSFEADGETGNLNRYVLLQRRRG